MADNRKIGLFIGILYIIGTVSGILSVAFTGTMENSHEYFVQIALKNNQFMIGALFILCMGFSLAFIPIILYPIISRQNKALALGYVVFRSALETITYVATFVCMMVLLEIGKNIDELGNLGILIFRLRELITLATTYVFSIGAFIFYYMLYRQKLVPYWLSIWGFIAIILHFLTGFLIMFGLQTAMSTGNFIMNFPIFLQEMVMAIWLIIEGFNFGKTENIV